LVRLLLPHGVCKHHVGHAQIINETPKCHQMFCSEFLKHQ
jgi:hypothetical protein